MVDGSVGNHTSELARGQRFEFGANWARFLSVLDDRRIGEAEHSIRKMLDLETLGGRSFLDIGSGSGLFSLAARRLGARVHSFDFDPKSVACTRELMRRYFPEDPAWVVESGSVLDKAYVAALGKFDIVYSWGVLHHTGAMWEALSNAAQLVAQEGLLYIAIYNYQAYWSKLNLAMKRVYVRSPWPVKALLLGGFASTRILRGLAKDIVTLRNPLRRYRENLAARGMSLWHDWIDWVGGYPYEVAKPEQVFDFLRDLGFQLVRLATCGGGLGCNEYVFLLPGPTEVNTRPRQ